MSDLLRLTVTRPKHPLGRRRTLRQTRRTSSIFNLTLLLQMVNVRMHHLCGATQQVTVTQGTTRTNAHTVKLRLNTAPYHHLQGVTYNNSVNTRIFRIPQRNQLINGNISQVIMCVRTIDRRLSRSTTLTITSGPVRRQRTRPLSNEFNSGRHVTRHNLSLVSHQRHHYRPRKGLMNHSVNLTISETLNVLNVTKGIRPHRDRAHVIATVRGRKVILMVSTRASRHIYHYHIISGQVQGIGPTQRRTGLLTMIGTPIRITTRVRITEVVNGSGAHARDTS